MNPLSSFSYHRRHKRQVLLLAGLIAALTLGVYMMVGVTSILFTNAYYTTHYWTRMSRLSASGVLDSGIVAQIRAHPDVATVLPDRAERYFSTALL